MQSVNRHLVQWGEEGKFSAVLLIKKMAMKSFQLILLCLVCVIKSYGQGGRIVIEITKDKHKSYIIKVIESVNPRADSSWLPSIERDLNRSIPANKHIKKGKYIVSARFITDKEGNISNVECENDLGFGIGAEVVRALKKSGKWVSGKGHDPQDR